MIDYGVDMMSCIIIVYFIYIIVNTTSKYNIHIII